MLRCQFNCPFRYLLPDMMKPTSLFCLLYFLVLLLGFICVALTGYWVQQWHGGFSLQGSELFNWHPVCMTTGLIVLYGSAALVYRLPFSWTGPKLRWKLLHASLTLAAFLVSVLGLVAVFKFHSDHKISHLYSLHSWLGLAAVILFSCQWFTALYTFLLPWASIWLRSLYKPVHVFFGTVILTLSLAAAVAGFNEKLIFSLDPRVNGSLAYSSLPPEARFVNALGMLMVVFGLLVLWMLFRPAWQRPGTSISEARQPLLEDEE
ncbi:cytochrome b ascorbate-dependent protein 3 isoform X2 [Rhinatrema bivittatum]|uniref:cytochrome b ascorbate-dependent protein 3 isoform X2 n=1 Tax=Rhinatrema bivittatum TaxID=194408 RepID=UPI00112B2236|nr:cytochrome b ascorbate-dependent protein 3 isoform X2 [Rhinatrema bivittatum]